MGFGFDALGRHLHTEGFGHGYACSHDRAAGRIVGFHICDWLVPTNDVLNDRGMMGDGVIDVRAIRGGVEAAGYRGFVEIEIFSAKNWWLRPMAETLRTCKERLAPL